MECAFLLVDVFTHQPFSGAQIAVFPRAGELDEGQMQSLAREMNQSETVFVLPGSQGCAAELKVFSPLSEKDIGSHTTVAAAYALAHIGALPQTDTTHVSFLQHGQTLSVTLAHTETGLQTQLTRSVEPSIDRYVPDYSELQGILGLGEQDLEQVKSRPLFVSCDTPYLVVPLRSMAALYRARYNAESWAQSSASSVPVNEILVYCSETENPQADFHLRLVGGQIADHDDPPVGAAVPAFAAYLCQTQTLATGTHSLWVERGMQQRRQSLLKVEFARSETAPLEVKVGGDAVVVAEGKIRKPQ
ncbi:PhzF family phenazine biosynthesis protein [Spongiibacter nanhainus]|uniref:PhzF family phenazine biosynthesis protein n=1 Tax=Spongiibacter nanhainus TaxID=2794344 RepID=A0A7T4UNJ6_9GAMM|nr:PhzF family phenazine biosynthesis protein [Spongiibacter nanhainus]QQD16642.1 PhzF family phenazine biosynthesis protein [Spongiibacter nanhainus]